MNWIEAIGYAGTILTIVSYYVSTMIPLRIFSVASSVAFLTYGILLGSFPVVLMESVLLPLNAYRLYQMLVLIKHTNQPESDESALVWLRPFSTVRRCDAGQILFHRGDTATEMFYIESGSFILAESGIELRAGAVVGELGFLSPDNTRTQTLRSLESGTLLRVSYASLKEIYFQNPQFSFYFLRLVSARLFHNADLAARRSEAASDQTNRV